MQHPTDGLPENPLGQSLENQPSIPLYDQENDKPGTGRFFFGGNLLPERPAQAKEEEKTWLARICPLFSISYFLIRLPKKFLQAVL